MSSGPHVAPAWGPGPRAAGVSLPTRTYYDWVSLPGGTLVASGAEGCAHFSQPTVRSNQDDDSVHGPLLLLRLPHLTPMAVLVADGVYCLNYEAALLCYNF